MELIQNQYDQYNLQAQTEQQREVSAEVIVPDTQADVYSVLSSAALCQIKQKTVRREMLWVKDGAGTLALSLLQELLRYGHDHCAVTILEGILYADVYQPLFEDAVRLFGQEQIFAYYYDLPFAETLGRHQSKPNRDDFGEDAMRRWWREKDFSPLLSEKRLTADVSLEAAEERIYQAVML